MKRLALCFCLLAPLVTVASPSDFLGTIIATSGASSNNYSSSNKHNKNGTLATEAIPLPGNAITPYLVYLQCDVDVRVLEGHTNALAVTNTASATKGWLLSALQMIPLTLTQDALAIIPASGSGTANCDLFRRKLEK